MNIRLYAAMDIQEMENSAYVSVSGYIRHAINVDAMVYAHCIAICESCIEPFLCVAPGACACPTEWTGDNCTGYRVYASCACFIHIWTTNSTHIRTHLNQMFYFVTEPPQNVVLVATGIDSLQISWERPQQIGSEEPVYIVVCEFNIPNQTYVADNNHTMEVGSLSPHTTYTCCVIANSTLGTSSFACATQTTLETCEYDCVHLSHRNTCISYV